LAQESLLTFDVFSGCCLQDFDQALQ